MTKMARICRENEWITTIPKVDLHRHLQGSIRTSTILDIGSKYDISLPAHTVEGLDKFVKHKRPAKNLVDFLKPWDLFSKITVNSEVIFQITYEAIEDAIRDNIVYLELRFAPYTMSNNMKLKTKEILDAITLAITQAERDFTVIVKLILGIARVRQIDYHQYNTQILEDAQEYRDVVVGFDLTGNEADFPPRLYVDFFQSVREHGFKITVHAGEAAESHSVTEAIRLLRANRIGHGLTALEDPNVIELLTCSPRYRTSIPVEICPTSTYLTNALPKDQVIPSIRRFIDYGVPVIVGVDSPQVCNTTLSKEFEWLFTSGLISTKKILGILRNGINYSFAPQLAKTQLLKRFEKAVERMTNNIFL